MITRLNALGSNPTNFLAVVAVLKISFEKIVKSLNFAIWKMAF